LRDHLIQINTNGDGVLARKEVKGEKREKSGHGHRGEAGGQSSAYIHMYVCINVDVNVNNSIHPHLSRQQIYLLEKNCSQHFIFLPKNLFDLSNNLKTSYF
jgi:hypothetical protein